MRTRFAVVTLLLAILSSAIFPAITIAQTAPPAPTTSSLIVKVVAGLTADQQTAVVTRNGGTLTSAIPALRLLVVSVPIADLSAIVANYQADPQVQSIEENRVRVSESVPSDLLYANQWALPRIGWDQVFGVVMPAGSAKVAVLDTGVDATHPELADKVLAGTSILDGSNGMTDPSGHGTWLAGIIAAQTDTIPGDGIAGVGYAGVKILPVTVLNANGEGQDSDVIAGVIWAVDHGADVILMAFSAPEFSQNLQDAIDYAWSRNIVVVAAVGNNAVSTPTFPAGDRGVMGVAATDQNDALASFSNAGQAVFIAAPGVDIQTIDTNGNYIVISGTSTAAAYVAGLAAFMKAVDPTLSNGVIVGRIARNADPAATQAETGNGRIFMPRALADTSTEFVQPAGTAPVGDGGPFIGPYVAAADATNTTIVSSVNPSSSGQSVTFTATVTCDKNGGCGAVAKGAPLTIGTIKILDGFNNCNQSGTGTVLKPPTTPDVNGQVSVTTSTLSTGTHAIRACYTGTGGGDGTSDSNQTLTQTVVAVRSTSTSLNLSPTSVAVGQSSTATVTVTDTASGTKVTPTGTVSVTSSVGTDVITTPCTLAQGANPLGTAECTVTITPTHASVHNITATFPAGAPHTTSTDTKGLTVNTRATATAVTFGASPIVVGQTTTVNVTVTDVDASGTKSNPTGTVSITSSVGSDVITGTCSLTNSGTDAATCSVSIKAVSASVHNITATFPATSVHSTSTDTKGLTVNTRATSTVVTFGANPIVVNETTTVNVTVTDIESAGTKSNPTGTVIVSSSVGSDVITGTCSLTNSGTDAATCSVSIKPVSASIHDVTATFAATSEHTTSTDTKGLTVNTRATSTAVTFGANPVVVSQTTTINVKVTDIDAAGIKSNPTGTVAVTSSVGSDLITGTCALSNSGPDAATCAVSFTAASASLHNITASFSATSVHSASADTQGLTVNTRATSTAVTFAANPVVVGQTTTINVNVTDVDAAGTKSNPIGTVAVSSNVGSDVITGTCALSNSGPDAAICSVSFTAASASLHNITASFSATTVHSASADTKSLTVNTRSTTTTVTLSPSAVIAPGTSAVTVTVTDSDIATKFFPTGTVGLTSTKPDTFGGACVLAATLTAGVSTCSTTVSVGDVGNRTISANFAATSIHSASNGSAVLSAFYNFTGFYAPVDNSPVVNLVQAGQAVPVKWRLTDANGVPVTDPSSFLSVSSYQVSCGDYTGAPESAVDEAAAGSSGLLYLGNGNWQFNWKTPKDYAGQCRVMLLNLKDVSDHQAQFKFKK